MLQSALNGSVELPEPDRAKLRDLLLSIGETAATREMQASRQTLARAVAGFGLRRGTVVWLQQRLSTVNAR